jgi:hypothetical protein
VWLHQRIDVASMAGIITAGTARLCCVTTTAGFRTAAVPQAASIHTMHRKNASDLSRTIYAFQNYQTITFCPSKRHPLRNSALCPKSAIAETIGTAI